MHDHRKDVIIMTNLQHNTYKDTKEEVNKLRIAIDTGKAYTKSCYRDNEGNEITDKFISAIGIVSKNPVRASDDKAFKCDLFRDGYYIDVPGLCDITPTSDNEKNGSGLSTGENNHDREIVTLGASLSIVKAMKRLGMNRASVDMAIGAPITEYVKPSMNKLAYSNSIIPLNRWIECRYEGITYNFIVKRSIVCPETISSFYFNGGTDKGNMILVDIGGNNIQYVCSTNGVINFDREKTFTAKGGVNTFARRIHTMMEQNQIEPVGSVVEITGWLADPKSIPKGYANNWKERFRELVETEKKEYFGRISRNFDTVNGNYKDEIIRGYAVCYTGGGSILFRNEIKASGGIVSDGREYANVMGFFKMCRW